METTDRSAMNEIDELQGAIIESLGLYRAEYTDVSFSKVFTQPTYWRGLVGRRPTFLIGGRGTGKTMALRMLAYDGQRALHGDTISDWETVGIYWRIGVNAVSAFRGARLDVDEWTRLFSHYVNLQLVDRILRFVEWRRTALSQSTEIDAAALRRAALSMSLAPSGDPTILAERVRDELAIFESRVNGIVRTVPEMPLSILGVPLGHLLEALSSDPVFEGRFLSICVDEFENLDDYQQRVFNTLLKHVGDAPYTMKVGVKPTGQRDFHTLNVHESISETADYSSLDIVQNNKDNKAQSFGDFAARVCNERFQLMPERFQPDIDIRELFPEVSEEQEAELLGIVKRLENVRDALALQGATARELEDFDRLPRLSAYLVHYWAQSKYTSELAVLREAIRKPGIWNTRVGNYGFTMLFTVSPRIGPTTRKLYAGWTTLLALADGNIRYLLDLVTSALVEHVGEGQDLRTSVSPMAQTRAAQEVARKLVFDLEGKDDLGKQIMRVVQGLGRIFGVMASDPYGHAPEVTQFRIEWSRSPELARLEKLVDSCVMHSGFVRFPGNKRAAVSGETRQYDYQLHPIFAPYFVYSYRRKRRTTIAADEMVGMSSADHANQYVEKILRRHKRFAEQYSSETLFGLDSD